MDHILITGTSSGIGLQAAIELSFNPKTTLITINKNQISSKISEKNILHANPNAIIRPYIADLFSISDVINVGNKIRKNFGCISTVIFNSGVMFCPYRLNADGIESHQAINFVSHVILYELISEALTGNAEIIVLSSVAYKWANLSEADDDDFLNINHGLHEVDYGTGLRAYAYSKLLLLVWAREQAEKEGKQKFSIIHPGICNTGLFRYSIPSFVIIFCHCLGIVKSVRGGSRAILDVLQYKEKESGAYWADGMKILPQIDPKIEKKCREVIKRILRKLREKYYF